MASQSQSQSDSAPTLLDLPIELQLQIYTYVFTLPSHPGGVPISLAPPHRSALTLLTLNKHIYALCLPLFYTLNTLYLSTPTQLYHFLKTLPPARRKHIRSLSIGGFGPSWRGSGLAAQGFGMLQLLPGLEEVYLGLEAVKDGSEDWSLLLEGLEMMGLGGGTWPGFVGGVEEGVDRFVRGLLVLGALRGVRLGGVSRPRDTGWELMWDEVEGSWVEELRELMGRERTRVAEDGRERMGSGVVMGPGEMRARYLLRKSPEKWEAEGRGNVGSEQDGRAGNANEGSEVYGSESEDERMDLDSEDAEKEDPQLQLDDYYYEQWRHRRMLSMGEFSGKTLPRSTVQESLDESETDETDDSFDEEMDTDLRCAQVYDTCKVLGG